MVTGSSLEVIPPLLLVSLVPRKTAATITISRTSRSMMLSFPNSRPFSSISFILGIIPSAYSMENNLFVRDRSLDRCKYSVYNCNIFFD